MEKNTSRTRLKVDSHLPRPDGEYSDNALILNSTKSDSTKKQPDTKHLIQVNTEYHTAT